MFILRNIASFVKNGGRNHFKLILKSKVFYIPSEFPNLNDVDQDIYSTLTSNREYNVLSNVSDDVFQSFINNWVYNKVPDIQKDNFYEYEQLAKEFDRMKDIIQMNNFYIILKNKKEALAKLINEKKLFRDFQNRKYHKIISIYNKYNNNNNQLKYPIRFLNGYSIEALSVDLIKKLLLDSEEMTNKLKITKNIKSLKFSNDSNSIFIPSNIEVIEDGWGQSITNLQYISISPSNRHFIYYKNEILIGKLNDKSDNFDNLIFARRDIEKIEIPPFIKRISSYAFAHCINLKSFEFTPNSEIKSIGKYAFYKTKIEKIIFPSSINDLNPKWFYGGLDFVNLFHLDSSNKTFKIYDNIFMLKKSDPQNNSYDVIVELLNESETMIIPSFITEIGPYVFQGSLIRRIEFENNSQLRIIGKSAFADSNLECIAIPQHVIEIGKKAFCNCNNLNKIDFAENAEIISFNERLFENTKLTNIKIPASVVRISSNVFYSCPIKNIEFQMNSKLKSIHDVVFSYKTAESICFPSSFIEFKNTLFFEMRSLNEISIFQNGQTNIVYSNKMIFGKSELNEDNFNILLLAERNIENVVIPSFIKIINKFAFEYCRKIKKVTFSKDNNLQLFDHSSFKDSSIKEISIPINVIRINSYSFNNCKKLTKIDFIKNSKLKIIDKCAFSDSAIEAIVVPKSVIKIKRNAFCNCTKLKKVIFENDSKLVKISNSAFSGCSFNSMLIPANVMKIGYYAFDSDDKSIMIFEVDENSKLFTINLHSFNNAILMIPAKLNGKIKFNVS